MIGIARVALPMGWKYNARPLAVETIRARTLPLQPLTKAVDVMTFYELSEYAVAEQDSGKPREI